MSRQLPEVGPGTLLLPPWCHVTPSNINPWRGARQPDQIFTSMQLTRIQQMGLDHDTCEVLIVRSLASYREAWAPIGSKQPHYLMPCPVLRRSRDGSRVMVLSPGGMVEWVNADGTIAPPKKRADYGRRVRAAAHPANLKGTPQ
jgi:hypothetical protein